MSEYAKIEKSGVSATQANNLAFEIAQLNFVDVAILSTRYNPSTLQFSVHAGGSALFAFRSAVSDTIDDEVGALPETNAPVDLVDSLVKTAEDS